MPRRYADHKLLTGFSGGQFVLWQQTWFSYAAALLRSL